MTIALTQVTGVGPSTAKVLVENGFKSAEQLAGATVSQVASVPGFGVARATRAIDAAKKLLASAAKKAHISAPKPTRATSVPTIGTKAKLKEAEAKKAAAKKAKLKEAKAKKAAAKKAERKEAKAKKAAAKKAERKKAKAKKAAAKKAKLKKAKAKKAAAKEARLKKAKAKAMAKKAKARKSIK